VTDEPTQGAERIDEISQRLAELAEKLRDPTVDDAAAQEMAAEAAELTAEASDEVVRRLSTAEDPAGDEP
jgi:hypothetical protein